MPNPPGVDATPGYTGITASGPGSSAFTSVMASLSSEFANTAAGEASSTSSVASHTATTATAADSSTNSANNSKSSAASTSSSKNAASSTPTTLLTSTTSADSLAASTTGNTPNTATNAASSASAGAVTVSDRCHSVSCSSGLQAAVAVPVVVGVLAIFALIFFCVRRRRKRDAAPVSEKKKPKKKWSRHLRVFSFDAELLMGGRFSSSNSVRTGETPSLRSGRSARSQEPSVHSIEEVAPPYRDAISHAQPPVVGTGGVAASIPARPPTATSPPPYRSITSAATAAPEPRTPTSARNPFADSAPVSPIEGSPFNDPADEEDDVQSPSRPMISRNTSRLQDLRGDNESVASTIAGSDAASIREAQVARNVSVRSGLRTINPGRST